MNYPAVASAFYNQAHAITPEKLAEVRAFLERKFESPRTLLTLDAIREMPPALDAAYRTKIAEAVQARQPAPHAGPRDNYQMVGRIAVVPVMGIIAQRANMLTDFSGGVSTELLGATIDSLVADRSVKAIVLNVDSPGGSVYGVPELADKLLKARDEKKVVAVANATAASAAYWLASQTSEIVVTPSGSVGSIGVVAAHTDETKAEEQAGVKTTLVTAGRYKAELHPSQPLSAEARDSLQADVDKYYGMFVKAVAKGRGVTAAKVDGEFGQGRMVLAADAVAAGMADRVATLEQTLRRLGGDEAAAANRSRAAQLAEAGLPIR